MRHIVRLKEDRTLKRHHNHWETVCLKSGHLEMLLRPNKWPLWSWGVCWNHSKLWWSYLCLPWSTVFAAHGIKCCECVYVCARGGFDREVEIWCMSLQGELVAVEVREQLVAPLSVWNIWRWTQSQESSNSFPARANTARSISAMMATTVFWPTVLRGGSFWLSSLAVQYFVLRLRLPKEGPAGQIWLSTQVFVGTPTSWKKVIWFSLFGLVKCNLAICKVCFDYLGHINKHFGDQGKYSYFCISRLSVTSGVLGQWPYSNVSAINPACQT